ncbi:MAG: hypothetical protein M1391_15165 [Bacteroidetes bacterium]|nr:hypothetical protein [Bacteroidota bacterium]
MNKIYNDNDNKHSSLLKDLKNLPKINAPDNFEFNLMTRIENKNFNLPEEVQPKFNLFKFLAPSAVVVTAVLLFFIFYPRGEQLNSVQTNKQQPLVSQSIADNTPTANTQFVEKVSTKKENPAVNQKQITTEDFQDQALRDQAHADNRPMPLQRNPNSVSVDRYISGDNFTRSDLTRGNVVNSGDQPLEGNGFLFKQRMSQQTLKRYREVVDSLKKAQLRLDSLKKASKIPQ